jgi:hypothetical protein
MFEFYTAERTSFSSAVAERVLAHAIGENAVDQNA